MSKGLISIVGSGPGDPDLITQKGIKRLERADIVFHDKLSPNRLIEEHCSEDTLIEDVGKRKGKVGPSQAEINERLVEAAQKHDYVVRLKGGDPFLFGRGGEETEYLAENQVDFEIIPGVSSLTAAPASAGIPLTHRDHASSVGIITGHFNRNETSKSHDWSSLAQMETIVVFMGITRADSIAEKLIQHGMDPERPAAAIGWGATPKQESREFTLNKLADGLNDTKPYLPGVLVIGDVVKCRTQLNWFENKPLFGQSIMVTRPVEQAHRLSDQLKERGARVFRCPAIEIEPIEENLEDLSDTINTIDDYDWIVFTSRNGVEIFFDELEHTRHDLRILGSTKLACIGPGTSEKLKEYSLYPDLIPENYRAEELTQALLERLDDDEEILLPRAEGARDLLPQKLSEDGHRVEEIKTYRSTRGSTETKQKIESLLLEESVDMVTFMSSSTVENFFDMLDSTDKLRELDLACIGPITNQTLTEKLRGADLVPEKYNLDSFVRAITDFYHDK